MALSSQIEILLTEKLENFRFYFPFCFPKDDLKTSMKLFLLVRPPIVFVILLPLPQVAEINHSQPMHLMDQANAETIMDLLVSIMERAALVNYRQVYNTLWEESNNGDKYDDTGESVLQLVNS